MLVLSRKPGERILVGDEIVVTVVRVGGGAVRLGIEAPKDFAVIREELNINPPIDKNRESEPSKSVKEAKGFSPSSH